MGVERSGPCLNSIVHPHLTRSKRLAIVAVALSFMPSSLFGLFIEAEWEIDVIRVVLLSAAGLAVISDWASVNPDTASRHRRWSTLGAVLGGAYLLTGRPSLLVLCLSVVAAGALNISTERAFAASEELRRRLESDARRNA